MPDQPQEMVPPWEEFPTYERYCIGRRMGAGEGYLYDWYAFLDQMPKDYETRLAYLKRHRPAPPENLVISNWRRCPGHGTVLRRNS